MLRCVIEKLLCHAWDNCYMEGKRMKRFVALLLIAITVALPYSYAFCAENSPNYIVPNTISAKTLDDYNGIWHAKYCLINDMVFLNHNK